MILSLSFKRSNKPIPNKLITYKNEPKKQTSILFIHFKIQLPVKIDDRRKKNAQTDIEIPTYAVSIFFLVKNLGKNGGSYQ